MTKRTRWSAAAVALCLLLGVLTGPAATAGPSAEKTLQAAGVKGGLVVHVGCGDGKLTAALRVDDRYLVQGLDTDAGKVAAARKFIRSLGAYGKVSANVFDGRQLPYVDNLVNLVVADDLGKVPMTEVMRVLCPNGVALVGGKKTVKPRPDTIDEWTHYLHDASNNAVAQDTVVGPPRRMQWVGSPRYSRHHDKMSSVSAVVSAGGRVFTIMDEAPPVSILMAPQWRLIARDAFNGTILWKRPIGKWFSHLHGLKSGPADLPRKLVAVGERVYVTLALGAPVTALDAATGETVRTYAGTKNAREMVLADGVLYVQVSDAPLPTAAGARRKGAPAAAVPDPKGRILAIRADSGDVLWTAVYSVLKSTLTVDRQRVVFMAEDRLVCLDGRSGKVQWTSKPLPRAERYPVRSAPTLVLYEDVVLFAGGEIAAEGNRSWKTNQDDTLVALSASDGKELWRGPHPLSGYASAEDLFVIDGVVWCGETTSGHAVGRVTGRDVRTGKVVTAFDPDLKTYWFHHRCHRGKATVNYLLPSRTGIEFVDVRKQKWTINHWVRGACLYGVMPANGLLYAPQHPCACFLEAKLYGFNALAPARPLPRATAPNRLERGPAYGAIRDPQSPILDPNDWPTYRRDPTRSGRTVTKVPATVRPAWSAEVGGRLSAPVLANGRVFVASIDTHTVHAIDAARGKEVWQYTTGGRVDSPPTCWRGRVLFGSADGYVYCLRAADGALVWRFRAAPTNEQVTAFEQLESVWPVSGSVLLHDGVLSCVAGRSMFLDGGLRLIRLDPAIGKLLSETILDDRDRAAGKDLQDYARQQNLPVGLPDILSSDGRYIYMRSQPFSLSGKRLPLKPLPYAGNPERYSIPSTQNPAHAHLFSPTGFLDDTWWHRTYWIYGSRFLGGWAGYSQAGKVAPGGKILVFDKDNVYGFGRKPKYYRWTTPIEHQLFRAAKRASAGPKAPPRKPGPKGKAPKKTPGFAVQHAWTQDLPLLPRGMVLAGGTLFLAGPADLIDEDAAAKSLRDANMLKKIEKQKQAYLGRSGGTLWAVSAADGKKLSELRLDTIPVFDGLIAAGGKLYMTTVDGRLVCLSGK